MTPRYPWVVLCSHSQINYSSAYLNNTVSLAVMLLASWYIAEGKYTQKVHIGSHDRLQNFITSIFNHDHSILSAFDG